MKRELWNGFFKIDCITCLIHDFFLELIAVCALLVSSSLFKSTVFSFTNTWFHSISPRERESIHLIDWFLMFVFFSSYSQVVSVLFGHRDCILTSIQAVFQYSNQATSVWMRMHICICVSVCIKSSKWFWFVSTSYSVALKSVIKFRARGHHRCSKIMKSLRMNSRERKKKRQKYNVK